MNSNLRSVFLLMALTGFVSGPALAQTSLARLPLKATVLAKPNVIFGYDDSGSMDLEVMLDSNDGVYWYDHSNGLPYDGAGKFFRRIGGSFNDQWRRYVYLFPNGVGAGLNLKGLQAQYDYSIPPTSELAFLRSSDWNPQYYNPMVTYRTWGEAHTYPAATFPNADPTKARGHPLYGGATNFFNLTATRVLDMGTSDFFIALNGMTLPAGAQYSECNNGSATAGCGGWVAVGANDRAARADRTTRLAMNYWPATYWVKAQGAYNCALPAVKRVGIDDCALAPDGSKLRRIEIRPTVATYPSGRTYAAELQNFANWFQYHRKRRLSANTAMSEVLENLTGLNVGIIRMGARPAAATRIDMKDLDAPASADNGKSIVKFVYEIDTNLPTPTRETLSRIGQEFANAAGPVKFACQRNAALIVTDGYANATDVSPPAYSAGFSKATYGTGAPYDTTWGGTLADLALYYYTNPLRANSATFPFGKVPTTAKDKNANLHMNTYAITLGAVGNIFAGENTPLPVLANAWVDPSANFDPVAVDDLWHATINGRGNMYLASTASETAQRIQAALNDIINQTGAQGGLAVSTVNLMRGDNRAYFGTYNPAGWAGDLTAHPINAATGVVDALPASRFWSASDKLAARAWATRSIMSHNGTNSIAFTSGNVGARVNPGNIYGVTNDVVNYLRGDRSGEGLTFRTRNSLLGAVINSEPTVDRENRVAYVQSGEGMLHAFDTSVGIDAGNELWAFVPNQVLNSIGETTKRGYVFRTQLDGPITLAEYGATKLLVAGMGAAGNGYYALNVSNPRGLGEASLPTVWQFPAAADAATQAKMGKTVGRARLAKHPTLGYVVLVTSGYNAAADGKGRMWMLNAATGAIIREFVTADGSAAAEAGLAQISNFVEDNGTTQFVYGGDLLGNLWRFDLVAQTTTKIAVLRNGAGQLQPVTAAPELTRIKGQRVVLVGTGKLLDIVDFGATQVQTMYAIADGGLLANARTALQVQTYTNDTTITSNAVDWVAKRGWYVDLPAGENANTQPSIAYGGVAFVTNSNGLTDCSASSKLYVVDVATGGNFGPAGFVSSTISDTSNSSGVTALATSSGKIVGSGQDADGKPWNRPIASGAVITPAKNSWLELRSDQ